MVWIGQAAQRDNDDDDSTTGRRLDMVISYAGTNTLCARDIYVARANAVGSCASARGGQTYRAQIRPY